MREYRTFLRTALSEGYTVVPLGRFLDDPELRRQPSVMVLRHDVDQSPTSVLDIAEVERDLGISSTWYFRWRTADPVVVNATRALRGEIGLHYETLSRRVVDEGLAPNSDLSALLGPCRESLREEVATFQELFGESDSIAAHGDTRVGWVSNLDLVDGPGPSSFGVRHDANLSLRAHRLGAWLTDRSAAEGSWANRQEPAALFAERVSPILCLVHPNNWIGGPALWRDRVLKAALPDREPGHTARIKRALPDAPPISRAT
jgi:hypothetical protein